MLISGRRAIRCQGNSWTWGGVFPWWFPIWSL